MGGRLFALWDGLDTADNHPESNTDLRLRELVARAEREAVRTSQRSKLAAQHRARKGLHQPSSRRPFGHTADWMNLVPHEAELLHEAASRIVEGESPSVICRDWTEGHPYIHRKTAVAAYHPEGDASECPHGR